MAGPERLSGWPDLLRIYCGERSGIVGAAGVGGEIVPVPAGTVAVGSVGIDIMGAVPGGTAPDGTAPGGIAASGGGGLPARAVARLLAFRSSVVDEPVADS
ncbi:hypothetical protein HLH44_12540 [Gluconacetobacter sp. 1c LMG 22058]|uniref:Uncharacterized protein n=1 Tax=Gluconacetobacter dulcium TaxID=2729096 RepID=A0A7W4K0Y8_9PROT|nr:hypothetical protein [Gluconacetobacter dulcium]MBB2198270.1 hypothetical protein [Gluconacetobacter dulcium]